MQKTNKISLCNNAGCIHAYGKYADMLMAGVVLVLVVIGVSAALKSISNQTINI
jgi:hypothetical protein